MKLRMKLIMQQIKQKSLKAGIIFLKSLEKKRQYLLARSFIYRFIIPLEEQMNCLLNRKGVISKLRQGTPACLSPSHHIDSPARRLARMSPWQRSG